MKFIMEIDLEVSTSSQDIIERAHQMVDIFFEHVPKQSDLRCLLDDFPERPFAVLMEGKVERGAPIISRMVVTRDKFDSKSYGEGSDDSYAGSPTLEKYKEHAKRIDKGLR